MKPGKINILSTRPLAHASMLKAEFAGVAIDTESFIETRNSIDSMIAQKVRQYAHLDISVAFTSMNAVEAVIDCLSLDSISPEWMIYSMGGITQTIIKGYFGDSEIISIANNSAQLAQSIIEDNVEEITFFCGNQRREELPKLLAEKGIRVNEIVVYETIETPVKISKDYNGILFFSPSAVRSFFSINNIAPETVLFAIGATTAHALKAASPNKVITGDFPDKEKLAEKAVAYFS